MRDSRVGSFGATALVMMLLVRFFALHEIARSSTPFSAPFSNGLLVPLALIAGHSLSRLCSTLVLASLDYARVDGKAKAFNNRLSAGELAIAVLCAVPAPLFLLHLLPPLHTAAGIALAALATLWLARLFKRKIGGYTRRLPGRRTTTVQQWTEVAFYCGLLCRIA